MKDQSSIPPLITFLTFNRMGNMILSLKSLLETEEDFELYIIDNFSQDKTWEYLQTVEDPRIKLKHRFDSNIGGAAAVNYGLSFRKKGQDWINYEYDCLLKTKNMVSIFKEYHKEFPNYGSFSGTLDTQIVDISKLNCTVKNNLVLFDDSLMGFCLYIPAETMDLLGFLDEESSLQDQELNFRQSHMGLKKGYAINVPCEMIGVDCAVCKKYQNVCIGPSDCVSTYLRVTTDWWNEFKSRGMQLLQKRISENRVYCGTRHVPGSLTENELKLSLENSDFFSVTYNDFLSKLK